MLVVWTAKVCEGLLEYFIATLMQIQSTVHPLYESSQAGPPVGLVKLRKYVVVELWTVVLI